MTVASLWSELVPYRDLARPSLLAALAARRLGLYVAVTPPTLDELPGVVLACKRAGVRIGVWPMLAHTDGRWPSAHNVGRFSDWAEQVLTHLDAAQARPDAFAIDLEPPIEDMPGLLAGSTATIRRQLERGLRRSVRERFTRLTASIEARGIATLAAAFPFVVADAPGTGGWQRLFGTPVDAPAFSKVSCMVYTSMIEGYARGQLRRADAVSLLGAAARAAHRRYGQRASLSLGAVGSGILGDEPTYRSPTELAEDVAVARAAGVRDLVLFSLGGVLDRRPMAEWLDALETPAAPRRQPLTPRAALAAAACVGLARSIEGGHRLARWRAQLATRRTTE